MSLQELAVPFVDVRGDALCWALGLASRPCLASRTVTTHDVRIELRVLGASHQVLVHGGAGATLLSETVACNLPRAASMPAHAAGPGYDFTSAVERLAPDELAARVEGLQRSLGDRGDAILAAFPGVPHAVTALALSREVSGAGWESWHAYPQTGELVHTVTRFSGEVDTHV